jgi:drug/metabolite transporter (DMT)-like permease
MSSTALALVLSAGLLHAIWNIVAKKSGGDHRFAFLSCAVVAVMWLPVAAWIGLGELLTWTAVQWGVVLTSAFIHALYFNVLLTGYRKADLTVVYPVARGTGPLLASMAAVVVLGETVTAGGVMGVLAVCGGIFLLAGGVGLWQRTHDPLQRRRALTGVRWGLATGSLIATYTVLDGYAIKALLLGPVLFDYVGNVIRAFILMPTVMGDRPALWQAWRAQWPHALFVAAISPLAYILVLTAVQQAPLSHVAPAREVSMLFAAMLGGSLLGEKDRGARIAGACCMAAGVMALAWG